jgi:HEAT repeat protein
VRRHAAYALADLGRPGLEKLAEVVERTDDRFAREIAQEALDGGFLQDSA